MRKTIKVSGVQVCPFCNVPMYFNHACPMVDRWTEAHFDKLMFLDYFYG